MLGGMWAGIPHMQWGAVGPGTLENHHAFVSLASPSDYPRVLLAPWARLAENS